MMQFWGVDAAFKKYLRETCAYREGESVLLALSGGPDSVLLFHLLLRANVPMEVAHCNFKLRAEESEQDELFVRNLCDQNKVLCHVKVFDLNKAKGSIQMQARELRYAWFEELREARSLTHLAVGSNLDDKFETAIMNFMNSCGPSGIRSIQAKRNKIIRPLLWAKKEDIMRFLKEKSIDYRVDSSNAKHDYLRNAVRHELVPVMKKLKPSVLENYERSAQIMREHELIFEKRVDTFLQDVLLTDDSCESLTKKALRSFEAPLSLLHAWLSPKGFTYAQLSEMLKQVGKSEEATFESSEHVLIVDRASFHLVKGKYDSHEKEVIQRLPYHSKNFGIQLEEQEVPEAYNDGHILLDLDKLQFPLEIRRWTEGDSFRPLGMNGQKKLSDYFTDKKLSALDKRNSIVLVSDKSVVCVFPWGISEKAKLDASSKRCLKLTHAPTAS